KRVASRHRLQQRMRNVLAQSVGQSTGRRIFDGAVAGGALALGRAAGIAAGNRADLLMLDAEHPDLAERSGDRWLDAWIFTGGAKALSAVMAGGELGGEGGGQRPSEAIAARYPPALAAIRPRF